jgi:DNA topoisomerase I
VAVSGPVFGLGRFREKLLPHRDPSVDIGGDQAHHCYFLVPQSLLPQEPRGPDRRSAAMANIEAGYGKESLAEEAKAAGLVYVSDERPGIARRELSGHFSYLDAAGHAVREARILNRIRQIAIPPAWTDVWIAPTPNGHIQATGRDARGRKQYCYHPEFRSARDTAKYDHILEFAAGLPKLRRQIDKDMRRHGLPQEKVLATVVHLLDTTLIRVGNADYAKSNGSFGLTTLKNRHVDIDGGSLRFEFKGKSGKIWRLKVHDRRVARIVRSCQDIPGQHLFQYLDEAGERQAVDSADINAYLRETTGRDITAKDFRTWAGTVLAFVELCAYPAFDAATTAKANLREAIEHVAVRLGNTPTICRKCYVHPAVIESYLDGKLSVETKSRRRWLRPEEVAVLAFLQTRLSGGRSRPARMTTATPTRGR